jgi:hypothetical protein
VPPAVLEALAPAPRTWSAIRTLLAREGVMASGGPKLPGARAVLLDVLLDERGALPWMADLLLPSTEWLQEHFDREGAGVAPWRLHLRRYYMLASRRRPE